MGLGSFFSNRINAGGNSNRRVPLASRQRHAPHAAGLTHRPCRFEPLEQRTLLSVAVGLEQPVSLRMSLAGGKDPSDTTSAFSEQAKFAAENPSAQGSNATQPPDATDLGVVDFLELTDQASCSGELWYRLEARRPAVLTVERGAVAFGAETALTLYDVDPSGNLRQLATHPERIDYGQTVQGKEYFVHVSNVRSPVDLRLANLVVTDYGLPGHVSVAETPGEDRFEFTPGRCSDSASDSGVPHRVSINGLVYEFDPDEFDDIRFSGEHAIVSGSPVAETLTVALTYMLSIGWEPGPEYVHLKLRGPWGELTVGVDSAEIDAGGGPDVAQLHASVDSAYLGASPDLVTLMGERTSCTATGFQNVTADAYAGTAAVAATADLWDSAGNDTLVARPGEVTLSNGNGFSIQVTRYDSVNVHSELGGVDVAQMYDSEGNDVFVSRPQESVMEYADGSTVVAHNFEYAHAYGESGGYDVAKLYDSAGDDEFLATPVYAKLYGEGFCNRAKWFDYVHAYAGNGGSDTAYLCDSVHDDMFVATDTYGRLTFDYNNRSDYGVRAKYFDYLHCYAGYKTGDTDVAYLYGTAGDDSLQAQTNFAKLLFGALSAHFARAQDFASLHAYSGGGDNDVAEVDWETLTFDLWLDEGWRQV